MASRVATPSSLSPVRPAQGTPRESEGEGRSVSPAASVRTVRKLELRADVDMRSREGARVAHKQPRLLLRPQHAALAAAALAAASLAAAASLVAAASLAAAASALLAQPSQLLSQLEPRRPRHPLGGGESAQRRHCGQLDRVEPRGGHGGVEHDGEAAAPRAPRVNLCENRLGARRGAARVATGGRCLERSGRGTSGRGLGGV